MNAPEVVRRYAVTLLEAADETGVAEAVQRDVEGLVETLRQSEELTKFLANPLVGAQVQASALEQLFNGKVEGLTLNFLQLMGARGRAAIIAAALEGFLLRIGRRKFLQPLYEALAATPQGKEVARRIYAKARAGYHRISIDSIDKVLDWKP